MTCSAVLGIIYQQLHIAKLECMPDELTDFKLDTDKFGESYRNLSEEYLNTLELKSDLFTAILPDGSSFEFVIRKTYDGKIDM